MKERGGEEEAFSAKSQGEKEEDFANFKGEGSCCLVRVSFVFSSLFGAYVNSR